jgi:hypothetical protein
MYNIVEIRGEYISTKRTLRKRLARAPSVTCTCRVDTSAFSEQHAGAAGYLRRRVGAGVSAAKAALPVLHLCGCEVRTSGRYTFDCHTGRALTANL